MKSQDKYYPSPKIERKGTTYFNSASLELRIGFENELSTTPGREGNTQLQF